jgi:hypothetical protein
MSVNHSKMTFGVNLIAKGDLLIERLQDKVINCIDRNTGSKFAIKLGKWGHMSSSAWRRNHIGTAR